MTIIYARLMLDTTKFFGLHIDKELTWKTDINYLSKILSRNSGILNKLKHFFPTHILQTIYSSLISPYLNYGILAWGNTVTDFRGVLVMKSGCMS